MYIKFLIIAVFIFFLPRFSQGRQWITLKAGCADLTKKSLSEYVYISFFKNNETTKQTELVGAWGFYPSSGNAFPASVPAQFYNDVDRKKEISITIEITLEEFNKCLATKDTWAKKSYPLTSSNCVHFMQGEVKNISKLIVPHSSDYVLPCSYVERLANLNQQIAFYETTVGDSSPNKLSEGAIKLWENNGYDPYHTNSILNPHDKQNIFDSLHLKYSKEKDKLFLQDDDEMLYPLSCIVDVVDLNDDGTPEIFVSEDNRDYFGDFGVNITFAKDSSQRYYQILNSVNSIGILETSFENYPDLIIGNSGLKAQTMRWNGHEYKNYKIVSFAAGSTPPNVTFEPFFEEQQRKKLSRN